MPNENSPEAPLPESPEKPMSTDTVRPESRNSGRSGDWEKNQRARSFHRAGKFLGLCLLRFGVWAIALGCCVCLVMGILAQTTPEKRGYFITAGCCLVVGVVLRAIGYAQERTLRCQLCNGTPLHDKRCSRHSTAVALPVVSYSGYTVLSTLCTGKFRCSYCGTPFRLKKNS
jgi:undecaprenyl pyrophosphate phosphatase UppP